MCTTIHSSFLRLNEPDMSRAVDLDAVGRADATSTRTDVSDRVRASNLAAFSVAVLEEVLANA